MKSLKISKGNAKIKDIPNFSLLAGHTCPFANNCLSKVIDGRIQDGKNTVFRCFSASQEATFTNVFKSRKHNTDIMQLHNNSHDMAEQLIQDIKLVKFKKGIQKRFRIHVAGDFFNQNYFDAWIYVAEYFGDIQFYAYTKSIPYWVARKEQIPTNLSLTASMGGRYDELAKEHGLKCAQVVYSEQEAIDLGMEIDHDDSHAYTNDNKSFALLIHGVQPKGSKSAEVLKVINKTNKLQTV